MSDIPMLPVGTVHSTRTEATDDGWDDETAWIELAPGLGDSALLGLDGFSHAEIVFLFDRIAPDAVQLGARHPRGNLDWPLVGIFAQRGKARPNRIGVTICAIQRVAGRRLYVTGLDAIDGTPVLDIKPVMREFLPRGPHRQPRWADELMADYWKADGESGKP